MTALPPNAQRQLMRMRSLEPPIDLVDSIMAEVEATPQVRSGPDLRTASGFVLAAAAVLLAIAVLLRFGVPDVGPAPTPVPLDELPSAGSVVSRTSVAARDVPAAFGHGFLWLTNAETGELIRMDPSNGSIATPLVVTEPGSAIPIPLAITDSSVWVADSRDSSLVELDPATREERQRIPVEGSVGAIAGDGADLWLVDSEAGRLVHVDSAGGSTTLSVPIESATFVLVGANGVWVGDALGNVIRIDPDSGDELGRVDVGSRVRRLVANGSDILVLGDTGNAVMRLDIESMDIAARGTPVVDAAAMDGQVWALVDSGHLLRLDPDTLEPIAADLLEFTATDTLLTGGGSVWTTGVDEFGDAFLLGVAPAQ